MQLCAKRGSENPKVDLVVFSNDLPINTSVSENSKEKICAENFLAKKIEKLRIKNRLAEKNAKNSTQFAKTKSVQNVLAG